jgi:hypothetical protein
MADVSVDVPAGLVGVVRESAVLLYQATAESLHFSLRALGEGRGSLEEVQEHRARLAQLGAMLDAMGWTGAAYRDLRVTAPREVLSDAIYGALLDAGERLAAAQHGLLRGQVPRDQVRAQARELVAIDRLLRGVKAGGGA